jgi:hypothetical protein
MFTVSARRPKSRRLKYGSTAFTGSESKASSQRKAVDAGKNAELLQKT